MSTKPVMTECHHEEYLKKDAAAQLLPILQFFLIHYYIDLYALSSC